MVKLRVAEPVTYELFDENGDSLGQVILPEDTHLTGLAAGTVLLRRPMPRIRPRRVTPEPRAA
jgi:hypothetical protein